MNSEESRVLLKQIPACSNPVLDICDLVGSLWSSPLNIRNSETIQVKSDWICLVEFIWLQ